MFSGGGDCTSRIDDSAGLGTRDEEEEWNTHPHEWVDTSEDVDITQLSQIPHCRMSSLVCGTVRSHLLDDGRVQLDTGTLH